VTGIDPSSFGGRTQDFLEQTAAALGADPKAIRAQAKAGMK
jgi:hypothetical protein